MNTKTDIEIVATVTATQLHKLHQKCRKQTRSRRHFSVAGSGAQCGCECVCALKRDAAIWIEAQKGHLDQVPFWCSDVWIEAKTDTSSKCPFDART